MDPYILLNTQTAFDETKLQILDQVITVFYKTSNQNERNSANKIMSEFKVLPESWSYCDMILSNSKLLHTKFYALTILEELINSKWNLLNPDQKLGIRNFLVDYLIKLVKNEQTFTSEQTLINKLNSTIVLIAKQEWTTTWTNFLEEICSSSKSDQNLCENNLKIIQMLNDEVNKFWKSNLTTHKAQELKSILNKGFHSVFELLFFILENSGQVKKGLLKYAVRLFADCTEWFPLDYVFKEEVLQKLLSMLTQFPQIRLDIMKCFSSIFALKIEPEKIGDNQFLQLKQITFQLFKNYVSQMYNLTKKANLYDEYNRIKLEDKMNFEEFCLQFGLSLISFYKSNFAFLEKFDFILGTSQPSEFLTNFIYELQLGLQFLCQINLIPNEEIFKSCVEFWNWLSFKICFIKDVNIDPDNIPFDLLKDCSISDYISFTNQLFLYQNFYKQILDNVRQIVITRMTKPVEVKIGCDESGEIVMEAIVGTTYQSLYENLKECLIYLTHLDVNLTNNFMIESLQAQSEESLWNPNLLNSLAWSIGSIAGAVEENFEKKFLVMVIKHLLNLCENKKGKSNKAIVAANIMYVVGQYPRFLNGHWKFLKTVVKKLFEFMHEFHEGVQDFACETFLKISIKCGEQFVIKNDGENEPYILTLITTVYDDIADLKNHQKLMFFEAIGNIINKEPDLKKQGNYIQKMLQNLYSDWAKIFLEANHNPEILLDKGVITTLEINIKLNERVAFAAGTSYFSYGIYIYDNLLKSYNYYNGLVNQAYLNNSQNNELIKKVKLTKKHILKFLITIIKSNEDKEMIMNSILPPLSDLIEQYRNSVPENRDSDILIIFSEVLCKLKNAQYTYISSIWNFLCLFTLDMIKQDFQSYPEHRINFFILVKSLIFNAFDALFQIQDSNFNDNVLKAIIWAFKHEQPTVSETGLETLLALINNVNVIKESNGINVADPFYKTFFFELVQEIFYVLTDSFHKSGMKLQIEILQNLIFVVEGNILSPNIFDMNNTNKSVVLNFINEMLISAFKNLNKVQIETFAIGLFNKCYNKDAFKVLIRDFLIILKSVSENRDELYEEERKAEIELAKILEEEKKKVIPGLNPIYDQSFNQKISSLNYQSLTK